MDYNVTFSLNIKNPFNRNPVIEIARGDLEGVGGGMTEKRYFSVKISLKNA